MLQFFLWQELKQDKKIENTAGEVCKLFLEVGKKRMKGNFLKIKTLVEQQWGILITCKCNKTTLQMWASSNLVMHI